MRTLINTILICLTIIYSGCRFQSASSAPQKRYELSGKVISVDKAQRSVTVAHDAIPQYMDAMTMPFVLKSDWAFAELSAGDEIRATLVVTGDHTWLENPTITKSRVAITDAGGVTPVAIRGPGEIVPDFVFTNQDNRKINLRDFRGRALLLTFIYTRCPLPDYCILMSNNFADVRARLADADVPLRDKVHLLSISIDPAYDTPQVLRAYGLRYLKNDAKSFAAWDFVTAAPDEIHRAAAFFNMNYLEERGQIVHSLRTAVIKPNGEIYKIYSGNEWTTDEAINDLKAASKK